MDKIINTTENEKSEDKNIKILNSNIDWKKKLEKEENKGE